MRKVTNKVTNLCQAMLGGKVKKQSQFNAVWCATELEACYSILCSTWLPVNNGVELALYTWGGHKELSWYNLTVTAMKCAVTS